VIFIGAFSIGLHWAICVTSYL